MKTENILLEIRSVTKRFPGVLALDGVNLKVYAGEIHAICGENGAGKSTLMKVLSGAYPKESYEGEILIDGRPVIFNSTKDSEDAGIAMIYQEVNMHLKISVTENFFIGRWCKKYGFIDWPTMNRMVKSNLMDIGLDVDPSQHLSKMSISEQQMICIARALSKAPRILILDEPTSPLTSAESDRFFELLKNLKSRGITCILITHKMGEVFAHSDRVDVFRDGRSISSHILTETDEKQIVTEMVGRNIDSYFPERHGAIGNMVLKAEGITVAHPYMPGRNIVNNISFEVRAGEIVGFAGLVGAGRSETVNAIFGKTRLSSGNVEIEGRRVKLKTPFDSIMNNLALVTEDRKTDGFIPLLSVMQNITLPSLKEYSKFGFIQKKRERQAAKGMVDRLRVRCPNIDFPVNNLSGGNQQKVVFCKWLLRSNKIMLLDEPTRGIDVGTKVEIYKIMTDLVERGIGILLISSEMGELVSMSDRVYVLADGIIKGELKGGDLTQENIMRLIAIENRPEKAVVDWHRSA
jgi:ABC-type sugar transport system ATPase subunit